MDNCFPAFQFYMGIKSTKKTDDPRSQKEKKGRDEDIKLFIVSAQKTRYSFNIALCSTEETDFHKSISK